MKYNNIVDFINFREFCLFCHNKLIPAITSVYSPVSSFTPYEPFYCKLIDNKFTFNVSYVTLINDSSIYGYIDAIKNTLHFKCTNKSGDLKDRDALAIIQSQNPHLILRCVSKDCHSSYAIHSTRFIFIQDNKEYIISPFNVNYESFVVDNLMIDNDFTSNRLHIYNRHKNIPSLDFESIDFSEVDDIIGKIKTIVTFS